MASSLGLQRALYRQQRRDLQGLLAGASPAFRRYESRYRRATAGLGERLTRAEVFERALAHDVVLVGDYHTLPQAQAEFLALADFASAQARPVVLALELCEASRQRALDGWLAGRVSDATLLGNLGPPWSGERGLWPSFRPILELAKARGLKVIGIDSHPVKGPSLVQRDRLAGELIARAARAEGRPLVLALMGQFHLAPAHLPRETRRALGAGGRVLTVMQNAEGPYWRLAAQGLATTEAVAWNDSQLCLFNASPVACQQSFLDYLEAEAGDVQLQADNLEARFRALAQGLARILGVKPTSALESLAVLTPQTVDRFEKTVGRARFSKAEARQLLSHVGSRESAWIPRANLVWLASRSLSHAAEEATHVVRHLACGEAMVRPRLRSEAFFARIYEEALGFFGSRLLNPTRPCPSLAEWSERFHSRRGRERDTAAFVLALSASVGDGPQALRPLVPSGGLEQFHAVSHAVGYLIGEQLSVAWEAGRIPRSRVTTWFHDPLGDAAAGVCALAAAARPAPRRRAA